MGVMYYKYNTDDTQIQHKYKDSRIQAKQERSVPIPLEHSDFTLKEDYPLTSFLLCLDKNPRVVDSKVFLL